MVFNEYSISRKLIQPQHLVPIAIGSAFGSLQVVVFLMMTPLGEYPYLMMVIFMAGIAGIVVLCMKSTVYTVNAEGITEYMESFLKNLPGNAKRSTRFYRWNQVSTYKDDADLTRSLESKAFIKIKMTDGYVMKISQDGKTDTLFTHFRDTFLALVNEHNKAAIPVPVTTPTPGTSANKSTKQPVVAKISKPHTIIKEKSFYKTIWGKAVSVLFIGITLLLLYVVLILKDELSTDVVYIAAYRFAFVLIPGTIYIVYRSFIKAD